MLDRKHYLPHVGTSIRFPRSEWSMLECAVYLDNNELVRRIVHDYTESELRAVLIAYLSSPNATQTMVQIIMSAPRFGMLDELTGALVAEAAACFSGSYDIIRFIFERGGNFDVFSLWMVIELGQMPLHAMERIFAEFPSRMPRRHDFWIESAVNNAYVDIMSTMREPDTCRDVVRYYASMIILVSRHYPCPERTSATDWAWVVACAAF